MRSTSAAADLVGPPVKYEAALYLPAPAATSLAKVAIAETVHLKLRKVVPPKRYLVWCWGIIIWEVELEANARAEAGYSIYLAVEAMSTVSASG
jgi:hypothetical protein